MLEIVKFSAITLKQTIVFLIVLSTAFLSPEKVSAQGIKAGFHSGINLSDIHSSNSNGKWKFKPGPVQGGFVNFGFGRYLGIQTGIDFSTLYYEHRYPYTYYPDVYYYSSSNSRIAYIPYEDKFEYNVLSIPLQANLSIPSTPDLNISAGVFYSFISRDLPHGHKMRENDFGYIFSAGWSYRFGERFSGVLNTRYLTGRTESTDFGLFRHGSFDFSIGIAYRFREKEKVSVSDSSGSRFRIIYQAGVNCSWNGSDKITGSYSGIYTPSAGFRIEFPLHSHIYFQTGLVFEHSGYSISDSTDVVYAVISRNPSQYYANTRTVIDYITIPAFFSFAIDKNERFYFSTGPYISLKLNGRTTGETYLVQNAVADYRYLKTTVYNEMEKYTKGNDFGWTFGTGMNFSFLRKDFEIGLQYRYGFRDVFDHSAANLSPWSFYDTSINNRIFSISLGMKVPVK